MHQLSLEFHYYLKHPLVLLVLAVHHLLVDQDFQVDQEILLVH